MMIFRKYRRKPFFGDCVDKPLRWFGLWGVWQELRELLGLAGLVCGIAVAYILLAAFGR